MTQFGAADRLHKDAMGRARSYLLPRRWPLIRLKSPSWPRTPSRSPGRDRSGRWRPSICRAAPTLNIEAEGTPRKADDGRRVILGLVDPGLGLAKLP